MRRLTGKSAGFKAAAGLVAAAALGLITPSTAAAQDDPNPGALTFTGGLDVPTIYFFRGIRQEVDPGLTLWPFGDIGIALFSGEGALKSASVNFGTWNSLQTGSSGSDGPSGKLHYENDFYATFGLGFGGGVTVGTTYTAYTSPNNMFRTVKEIGVKVSVAGMAAPYVLLAQELGDDEAAGADGGDPGTYLELGVGPSFPLMADGPTLTIPVKLGLSLNEYYQGPDGDEKFGFLDIGALITVPLKGIPSQFGSWNIHGGANYLLLGDTTELFNLNSDGEINNNQVLALFGFGVTY